VDYQAILESIYEDIKPCLSQGKVASYIPALANADANSFAMSLNLLDGRSFHVGQTQKPFSIQSISKVFTFTIALQKYGKELENFVGHEPSGNPFNSLVQLEYEKGIARNPFINAGAITITDLLSNEENAFEDILDFVRTISHDKTITFDIDIAQSEAGNAYRNYALINMMKSFGTIKNPIEKVMNTYFKQCSIMMNTEQLSKSMLFLANHGIDPISNKSYVDISRAKRIQALMLTCGHYDASGDFAFRVGLPGKSGVGGGIVATMPNYFSVCVYSPALNKNGNSLAGTKALELLTTKTGLSIF
jgi:glutaminase